MNKRTNVFAVLVALLLCVPAVQPAINTGYPLLELWNKSDHLVKYEFIRAITVDKAILELAQKTVKGGTQVELQETVRKGKFISRDFVNDSKPWSVLAVKVGSGPVKIYTFPENTHIFVSIKNDEKLYPQTGPFGGARGITERGYPKNLNIKKSQIDPINIDLAETLRSRKG